MLTPQFEVAKEEEPRFFEWKFVALKSTKWSYGVIMTSSLQDPWVAKEVALCCQQPLLHCQGQPGSNGLVGIDAGVKLCALCWWSLGVGALFGWCWSCCVLFSLVVWVGGELEVGGGGWRWWKGLGLWRRNMGTATRSSVTAEFPKLWQSCSHVSWKSRIPILICWRTFIIIIKTSKPCLR